MTDFEKNGQERTSVEIDKATWLAHRFGSLSIAAEHSGRPSIWNTRDSGQRFQFPREPQPSERYDHIHLAVRFAERDSRITIER